MKFLSYSFLVFQILVSCQSNKIQDEKSILGIWRLSESVDHSLSSANKDPLLEEAQKLEEGKDGHVLSLFSDKSFTELKGNGEYFYGNWSWLEKDQKIQLKYSDRKIVYDVETNFTDTNAVVLQLKNPRKELTFIREAELLGKDKEEPFYAANNVWRIKPTKPESTAELENRLANYFQHMVYLLKAADQRHLDVISFEFSMGIIKIYNGGIGIHEYEILPQEWKNTYYDEKDVLEIYELYANYLKTSDYRGASSGSWVKDDYKIALSIYNDIKLGKLQAPMISE